jgi:hypothetical protein
MRSPTAETSLPPCGEGQANFTSLPGGGGSGRGFQTGLDLLRAAAENLRAQADQGPPVTVLDSELVELNA